MELKRGEELGLLKDSSVLALRTVIGTTSATGSSCVRRGNGVQTGACAVSCRAGAKYDVPVQFVAVAKPFKHQLGVVSSLLSLNWELYDDAVITKSPLYLRDGDLMLWRDLREVPKEIATEGLPQVYITSFLLLLLVSSPSCHLLTIWSRADRSWAASAVPGSRASSSARCTTCRQVAPPRPRRSCCRRRNRPRRLQATQPPRSRYSENERGL